MSLRFSAVAAACIAVSMGLAATSFGDAGPAPAAVAIDDYVFTPKTLTVPAGTEVVWTNKDSDPHTVVSSGDTKVLKSPPLDTGDTFSYVFTKPGTYTYFCSVHPHMTATIVVE